MGHAMDLSRRTTIYSVAVECRRIMEAQAAVHIQRMWRGYAVRASMWQERHVLEIRAGKARRPNRSPCFEPSSHLSTEDCSNVA